MATVSSSPSQNVYISGGTFIHHQSFSNERPYAAAFRKLTEAAAQNALYDGPARSEATRCYQGTRTDVLRRLQRWIEDPRPTNPAVFWLYGGAGAGKSAIMQTLCESWVPQRRAMGAFFFSSTDDTRNNSRSVIPTLAYQLAQAYPETMDILGPMIDSDPLVLKKSVETQTIHLLIQPLQALITAGYIDPYTHAGSVFLIDGVDECLNIDEQQALIRLISTTFHAHGVFVKFLIASRPEKAISAFFDLYAQDPTALQTLSLSDHKDSERDIYRWVVARFAQICYSHPFKHSIPPKWPPQESVTALVRKSSNHFIYASIAMKYIESKKQHPIRSLEDVLGLEVTRGDLIRPSPFPELDALYHLVLGKALYRQQLLQILAHCIFSSLPPFVNIICLIIRRAVSDFPIFLVDVGGLVTITKMEPKLAVHGIQERVQLLHASLVDFLRDKSRSRSLYLDEATYHSSHLESHFQLLDFYSQGKCSIPRWPLLHGPDGTRDTYKALGTQIFRSIQRSAHTRDTQHILATYDLFRFHSIQSRFVDEDEEFPSVYAGIVTYMGVIQAANIDDGGRLYKTTLEQFLDIFQSYLHAEIGTLAPAIIPLILSGYPIRAVRNIIYHFDGDRAIWYMRFTISQLLMQPSRTFHLGRFSVFDRLQLGHPPHCTLHREEAVVAILDHVLSPFNYPKELFLRTPHRTWMQRKKPVNRIAVGRPALASAFHNKCVGCKLKEDVNPGECAPARRKYLGLLSTGISIKPKQETLYFLLVDALIWLLPMTGYSERVLGYMGRAVPLIVYERYPKRARRLRRCFDAYSAWARSIKMRQLEEEIGNGSVAALVERARFFSLNSQD